MLSSQKCVLCDSDAPQGKKVLYKMDKDLWRAVEACESCCGGLASVSSDALHQKIKDGLAKKLGYVPVHLSRASLVDSFVSDDVSKVKVAEEDNKQFCSARIARVKSDLLKGM